MFYLCEVTCFGPYVTIIRPICESTCSQHLLTWFANRPDDGHVRTETCSPTQIKHDVFDDKYFIILVLNFNTSGCLQSNSHSNLVHILTTNVCLRRHNCNLTKLWLYTTVGTLIVATIHLQLIQNRYMFRTFTVLQCSHQHCVQPVASDVEVVGYL